MSHEVQSTFGVSCPNSTGSFYVCEDKPIRFVGCCTVDPCKTADGNCPDDELTMTSFDQYSYNQLLPQECVSDSPDVEWYTCAALDPPFMGCCVVNPCVEGECSPGNVSAARLSDDEEMAAIFLPEDYGEDDGLSTGAIAGIAVGAVVGGLLIIAALVFFYLRRKKARQQQQQQQQDGAGPYGSPKEQHPQSPHNTMTSTPMEKPYGTSGQVSPYAATFVSSPSMQHNPQSHLSWDGAQSSTSFSPSPYMGGQSPPMGQNGFPPSAYGNNAAYQQYMGGYQPQQQQQQQSYQELPGGDASVAHASELATTNHDDEVSQLGDTSRQDHGGKR